MEQGVGDEATRAGTRCGPILGPPDACGKRETRDKECRADVLDEVRVIGTGLRYSRNALVPGRAGQQHYYSVEDSEYRQNGCDRSTHGNLLRPRRAMGGVV